MKTYQIIVRRTSYEMIQVLAEDEVQASILASKGEGARTFKADDTVQFLAIKEIQKADDK